MDEIARNPAQEPEGIEEGHDHDEEPPRGTMIIMLIYLVILIGIWGSVYLTLIRRG